MDPDERIFTRVKIGRPVEYFDPDVLLANEALRVAQLFLSYEQEKFT